MNDKAKIDALQTLRDAFHKYMACPTVRNHEALLDATGNTLDAALTADASEQASDRVEAAKHGHLQWRKEREGNAPAAPVSDTASNDTSGLPG